MSPTIDPVTETTADSTHATAPAAGSRPALPVRLGRGFRRFRRTRPFWGGVLLAAGAYFIAKPLLGGSFAFYTTVGVRSITPLLIAGGMIAAALVAVILPAQRHFPAIVAMMLSVASLPLANLGGWLIGMVLGIVGSGLIFAWAPYTEKQLARYAERSERKAERKARKAVRKGAPAPAASAAS